MILSIDGQPYRDLPAFQKQGFRVQGLGETSVRLSCTVRT